MRTFLSLFVLASVVFLPTAHAQFRDTKSKEPVRTPTKSRKFVFRETAKVGDKFVWVGRAQTSFGGDFIFARRQFYSEEFIKKVGNRFIWKVTSGEKEVKYNDKQDGLWKPDKVEVETITRNGFGNLVSSKNSGSDKSGTYGEWPETPVQVGDTWKSRTVSKDKAFTNVHTLKAVKTIGGKEYLLISIKGGADGVQTQTKWFVFALHQSAKIEIKDEAAMEDGEKATFLEGVRY